MAQSEEYNKVEALIRDLKHQLAMYGSSSCTCEETAKHARKEIEEHFAICMNNLAARKEKLLKEVDQKVEAQRMYSIIVS